METPEVNLDAILAEVGQMDHDALVAELLNIKTKQRTASKKNFNKEKALAARKKRVAKIQAMVEAAKKLPATNPQYANRYEELMALANKAADEAITKTAEEEVDGAPEEEEVTA